MVRFSWKMPTGLKRMKNHFLIFDRLCLLQCVAKKKNLWFQMMHNVLKRFLVYICDFWYMVVFWGLQRFLRNWFRNAKQLARKIQSKSIWRRSPWWVGGLNLFKSSCIYMRDTECAETIDTSVLEIWSFHNFEYKIDHNYKSEIWFFIRCSTSFV